MAGGSGTSRQGEAASGRGLVIRPRALAGGGGAGRGAVCRRRAAAVGPTGAHLRGSGLCTGTAHSRRRARPPRPPPDARWVRHIPGWYRFRLSPDLVRVGPDDLVASAPRPYGALYGVHPGTVRCGAFPRRAGRPRRRQSRLGAASGGGTLRRLRLPEPVRLSLSGGTFAPRWMRWAALLWLVPQIPEFLFPQLPVSPTTFPLPLLLLAFLAFVASVGVSQLYRYLVGLNPGAARAGEVGRVRHGGGAHHLRHRGLCPAGVPPAVRPNRSFAAHPAGRGRGGRHALHSRLHQCGDPALSPVRY